MKTLIAVPCMDQVPYMFAQSLALLQKPEDSTLAMRAGSLVYSSRDYLARKAVEMDADYVFWMDSDMVFPTNTLTRLIDFLETGKHTFVTGLYFRRVPPYSPVLFDTLEFYGEDCSWSEFHKMPDIPFEVGACGFGCVLMKTDVIFDVQGKFDKMFTPIGNTGEDIAFCWRAREAGHHIFCDPSIICGHVGYSVVDDQFYRLFHNK